MDCSLSGSSIHGIFQTTGVGCHFLLQETFPTQESNQGLLHCRQILYQLSYEGSLLIFYPFNMIKVKLKKNQVKHGLIKIFQL